jgi:thiol-disulfide isomerase/thioredoxin
MGSGTRLLCTLSLVATSVLAFGQASNPTPTPAWRSDPKFVDTMKEAKQFEKQKRAGFAEDAYKKANKIAGGQCTECLEGIYNMQMWQGEDKDAIATVNTMLALDTDPRARSADQTELAQALLARAGKKPKPEQLDAVHATFQEAIATYPKNASAYFSDGLVLAQMGKMDEASADFRECLKYCSPKDPSRLRAEHFAENPELALHKMAPTFEVTALDGKKFNLDAMGGRVVLIDFWAAWCGPCNEELPHMKKIAKEFANDPLVIISVSWDSDDAKWKTFIQKNEMTWVQYRDADHKLSDEFGINAIPHYFTIDSDGVLTAEMLGEGSDVEGKLKKLIAKARSAQTSPANVSSASPATNSPAGQVALAPSSR